MIRLKAVLRVSIKVGEWIKSVIGMMHEREGCCITHAHRHTVIRTHTHEYIDILYESDKWVKRTTSS